MGIRILAVVILGVSIIFLPFWVSAVLAFGMMFYFRYFIEAVFLFLISDLIFGVSEEKYGTFTFLSMFLTAIMLLIIEYTKKKTRFDYFNKDDSKN
ncbi:MAG: hypothetical protein K9L98_03540 [Candidatus Pacebacteria bacterium]|nr:hypothetical protein [Candidatus Paceibacterota bacterium]MCF7863051.1 hypothetical protein [Candidatus Paceibacterota bacterium]